jgi:hypothetical protein
MSHDSNCPVCIWPFDPTSSVFQRSSHYGSPDADDEDSVSNSCKRHRRELDEIVERDKTGQHPKRDPSILAAEQQLKKAYEDVEKAEMKLNLARLREQE